MIVFRQLRVDALATFQAEEGSHIELQQPHAIAFIYLRESLTREDGQVSVVAAVVRGYVQTWYWSARQCDQIDGDVRTSLTLAQGPSEGGRYRKRRTRPCLPFHFSRPGVPTNMPSVSSTMRTAARVDASVSIRRARSLASVFDGSSLPASPSTHALANLRARLKALATSAAGRRPGVISPMYSVVNRSSSASVLVKGEAVDPVRRTAKPTFLVEIEDAVEMPGLLESFQDKAREDTFRKGNLN